MRVRALYGLCVLCVLCVLVICVAPGQWVDRQYRNSRKQQQGTYKASPLPIKVRGFWQNSNDPSHFA